MSKIKPMNLVYIFSDQHNKHMIGSYGNEVIKTPNIDKLAQNGVLFENAYCNSPVCVPSRSSMVTGDYAYKNKYWDNAHAFGGETDSWGTRLNEQGYKVTTIGKMHLKDDSPKTGFVDQRIPINLTDGIGDVYGSIRNKAITRPQFCKTIYNAGAGESDYIRYDRAVAKMSADFLKNEAKEQDKPFVLYIGFVSPHFPLIVPEKYLNMYNKKDIKIPIQFSKDEWPRHPVLDDYRRYCGTEEIDEDIALEAIRTYYGLCTFLDEQIGVVLDALKEAGLEENTRIIYSSDHGDTMGEHGLFYKSTMYEGSVGIPLIVSGPDIPKGQTNSTNVSLLDIFPSVIECVGAEFEEKDKNLPGTSLWDIAKGKALPDRAIMSEYYGFGIYTATFMLKKGNYKYIHYVNEPPQLFNLKDDINEEFDLSNDEKYKNIILDCEKELRKIINPEEADIESKKAQKTLLDKFGGEEEFLRTFKPQVFSPVPNGI